MLSYLSIHNLAIVEQLELTFRSGMTVLTGETGAGKSILIDALSLVLGGRADSNSIRHPAQQANVTATFELTRLPHINTWLTEHELAANGECIIKRSIDREGRSRAYINGQPVPLTQVRQLGEYLIDIHGQHQNQSLLKSDYQRLLLDEYAGHIELLKQVKTDCENLQNLRKEQTELLSLQSQNDKLTLLKYQIHEIEELNPKPNELEHLEKEHKTLIHAEEWLSLSQQALNALQNDSGQDACSSIHQALTHLQTLKTHNPALANGFDLLNNALIQIEEALNDIHHFSETITHDPKQLEILETRLSSLHALARKHKIQPEYILEHLNTLQAQASKLSHIENSLMEINEKLKKAEDQYKKSALELSQSRKKHAKILTKLIVESLHHLEMPNGRFEVQFTQKPTLIPNIYGLDEIEFLVCTNPGHFLQPLRKIASGGELSRISLAIQVITAQKMTIPTLIFDEVDVGISGKTAEIVGTLIRKLSQETQVLCVTHLPQVAAQAHHHYKVEKQQTQETTTTHIQLLDPVQKIQEIARLLGGVHITQHALLHAEEMIKEASV